LVGAALFKFSAPTQLAEAEILVSIEKKNSKFSAPPHLAEAENLLGLEEKTFQKCPHHNPWLRRKI
jgi:hypothetical protein